MVLYADKYFPQKSLICSLLNLNAVLLVFLPAAVVSLVDMATSYVLSVNIMAIVRMPFTSIIQI